MNSTPQSETDRQIYFPIYTRPTLHCWVEWNNKVYYSRKQQSIIEHPTYNYQTEEALPLTTTHTILPSIIKGVTTS